MNKKYKEDFFEKHDQNYITMEKKFIQFCQDKSFGKKRPLRDAARPKKKKKFLTNIGKGDIKKGSAKGTKNGHGWSLSIGLGKIL